MIYFDHNATTPLDLRVLAAMQPFLTDFYGNPSSLYRLGRAARSAIESAREQVAAFVGARAEQVVFTSGGTEANNLALRGLLMHNPRTRIAVSAIEHASVLETALSLQRQGAAVDIITVNAQGLVDAEALAAQCEAGGIHAVSVMWANNETGVIQNIQAIATLLRGRNVIVHSDAVQAAGKIPVDFAAADVHMLSLSSHKIYGPKGCGALVKDTAVTLQPLLTGGGQEQGLRSGTENVAAIVGFGKAAELAKAELEARASRQIHLRMRLEQGLRDIPGAMIFGGCCERLPNSVQFGIDGQDGEMLLMRLDRKGIAVSSGSACDSNNAAASHVLLAMGIETVQAKSAIRVSMGTANTAQEVDDFLAVLKALV